MHPRSVAAIVLIVALVAAGFTVVPGMGSDELASYVGDTTFPTTIDGVPFDEAPDRAVVEIDRVSLVGGSDAGPAAPSTAAVEPGDTSEPSAGSVSARTMSSQVDVDLDDLSAGDLELLASLGLIDPDAPPAPPEPAGDEPDGQPTDPAEVASTTIVEVDDATAASLLVTRIEDALDLEVEVTPVIGDLFAVTGSPAEPLLAIEGITAAEEPVLGMVFADESTEPGWFHTQWALRNTGQTVVGFETDRPGIAGVDIDRYLDGDPDHPRAGTGEDVVVAVIDTPFDTAHPSLEGRWWENSEEDCDPDKDPADTDDNGYVNDCWGWNFVTEDEVVTGSSDTTPHATHVAGTIAADGTQGAVVGVAPDARIMPLVVSAGTGESFPMERVTRAIRYAVDNGADIINVSLGTEPYDDWPESLSLRGLDRAIEEAGDQGVPIIAAAGNQGVDLDHRPVFPASYASQAGGGHGNVLAVGAMTNRGLRWPQSNHGRGTVGLAAPGVDIISTLPNAGYGYYTGTSMAAPHVAGVAALLHESGSIVGEVLVTELIDRGVPTLDWVGRSLTGGRLSLAGAPDPLATFTGLGGRVDQGEEQAEVHTTIQLHTPGDIHLSAMTVTLATHDAGQIYAVIDHPIRITPTDATAVADATDTPSLPTTNHEGALRTPLHDDEWVTLGLELPAGDYAWILEFGTAGLWPQVAAFVVTPPPLDDEAAETPGEGSTGGSCPGCPGSPPDGESPSTPTDGTGEDPQDNETTETGTESSSGEPPTGTGPGTPGVDDEVDDDPQNGSGSEPDPSPPPSENPGSEQPTGGNGSGNGGNGTSPGPDPIEGGEPVDPGSSRIRPSEGVGGMDVEIHGLWPNDALVRFGENAAYVAFRAPSYLIVKAPWNRYAGPVDVTVYVIDGIELRGIEIFVNGFTYLEGEERPPDSPGGGGGIPIGGGSPPADDGSEDNTGDPSGPDNNEPGTDPGTDPDPNGPETANPGDGQADGEEFSSTGPRIVGDPGTLNGLSVVRLGEGHPGYGLHGGLWPPACPEGDEACPGIPVLG